MEKRAKSRPQGKKDSKRLWLTLAAVAAISLAFVAAVKIWGKTSAEEKPSGTKYQSRLVIESCDTESGGFYAIAIPIDRETGEMKDPNFYQYSIGQTGPTMKTTSGKKIEVSEIKPGDIVVVNADVDSVHMIYPYTYTGPYYLTFEDS